MAKHHDYGLRQEILTIPEEIETGDQITQTQQTDARRSSQIDNRENKPGTVHEDTVFQSIQPMTFSDHEIPRRIIFVNIFFPADLRIRSSGFDERTILFRSFVFKHAPLLTNEEQLKEIT